MSSIETIHTSAARRPLLGMCLLAGILSVGVASGLYWPTLAASGMVLALGVSFVLPNQTRVIAVLFFYVAQLMNVTMLLRPDVLNYVAYAVLLLVVVGVAAAVRARPRVDLLAVFLGWLLISAFHGTYIVGPEPPYALLLMPLGAIGMYLVLRDGSEQIARSFLWGLLAWAGIEAALGATQTLFDLPGMARWGGIEFSEPRNYLAAIVPGVSSQVRMATGTFPHFNNLGSLMALVFPIAVWSWLDKKTTMRGMYLLLILLGLVCTFSRGALIGASIGAAIVLHVFQHDPVMRQVRLWSSVLGLVAAVALTWSAIANYAQSTANASIRFQTWVATLDGWFGDPQRMLFGAGLEYFRLGYLETRAGTASSIHSVPIQLLVETGLIGAVLGLVILASRASSGLKSHSPRMVAFAAGVIAFALHQAFDNAFFRMTGVAVVGLLTLLSAERGGSDSSEPVLAARDPLAEHSETHPGSLV